MHKIKIPRHHVNDDSAILLNWYIKNGSRVSKGDKIAELESTKASYDVEAPEDGIVSYNIKERSEVSVGGVLCIISNEILSEFPKEEETVKTLDITLNSAKKPLKLEELDKSVSSSKATRFSPKAKALIEKHGLDLSTFSGGGLIKSADVEARLGISSVKPQSAPETGVSYRQSDPSRAKRFEIKNLGLSTKAIIPSSVSVSCSTVGLKKLSALQGSPGSIQAILIFEVAKLLRKYPLFNGFYADGKNHLYDEVNIGFAMDAGKGLKVPVIKSADQKTIQTIQTELDEVVLQYLEDQLEPERLNSGTFTITDLSGSGVLTFVPVINYGQGAILGIGAEHFPFSGPHGAFQLVIGFDHQLSTGRDAALFLEDLKIRLSGYESMLLAVHEDEFFCCASCLRPLSELRTSNGHLLQSVQPGAGIKYTCSFCLGGW